MTREKERNRTSKQRKRMTREKERNRIRKQRKIMTREKGIGIGQKNDKKN